MPLSMGGVKACVVVTMLPGIGIGTIVVCAWLNVAGRHKLNTKLKFTKQMMICDKKCFLSFWYRINIR